MGAHGTLEEALANVASFATASQAKDPSSKHSSSRSSKHKTQKKHKKSKDKSKDRKGSHKKHKKKLEESSSEDSSSDEHQPDLSTQVARGREAVRITRRILSEYPDMRADLREVSFLELHHKLVWVKVSHSSDLLLQLLGRIDSGAGLAIDQLPIQNLHSLLVSLFDNLQLKKTRQVKCTAQLPVLLNVPSDMPSLQDIWHVAGCVHQACSHRLSDSLSESRL